MFKQYINGKLVDGKGKVMNVYNPATDEIIDTVGCANAEQTEEALNAASVAFKTWSKVTVNERANWLLKLRDACKEEYDTLVNLVMAIV